MMDGADSGGNGTGLDEEGFDQAWDLLDQEKSEFVEAVEEGKIALEKDSMEKLEELEKLLEGKLTNDPEGSIQNHTENLRALRTEILEFIEENDESDFNLEELDEEWKELLRRVSKLRERAAEGQKVDPTRSDVKERLERLIKLVSILVPGGSEGRKNLRDDLRRVKGEAQLSVQIHKWVMELEKLYIELARSVKMQEQLIETEKGREISETLADEDDKHFITEEMQDLEEVKNQILQRIKSIREAEEDYLEELESTAEVIQELDSIEDEVLEEIENNIGNLINNLKWIFRNNKNQDSDRFKKEFDLAKELGQLVESAEKSKQREDVPEFQLYGQLMNYVDENRRILQWERRLNFTDLDPLVPLEEIETEEVPYPMGSSELTPILKEAIETKNSQESALNEVMDAKRKFKREFEMEQDFGHSVTQFDERVASMKKQLAEVGKVYESLRRKKGFGNIVEMKNSASQSSAFSEFLYGDGINGYIGLQKISDQIERIKEDLKIIKDEDRDIRDNWVEAKEELDDARDRAQNELQKIDRAREIEEAFTTGNKKSIFEDEIPDNAERTVEGRGEYQRALAEVANELGIDGNEIRGEIKELNDYKERLKEELQRTEEMAEEEFEITGEEEEELRKALNSLLNEISDLEQTINADLRDAVPLPKEVSRLLSEIESSAGEIQQLISGFDFSR